MQCKRSRRRRFDPWVGKILWRGQWQPIALLLPGKSQGQKSLAGYVPEVAKESDITEQPSTAQMDLEIIILSEVSQAEKNQVIMWYHLYMESKNNNTGELIWKTEANS